MSALPPAGISGDMITRIFRVYESGDEELVGLLMADGTLADARGGANRPVGRVAENERIVRTTSQGERELGRALPSGEIISVGLLEGGPAGWLDPDGFVIRAGLVYGAEEVGRVEGPYARAGAAALLLLFLPDEAEANRRALR